MRNLEHLYHLYLWSASPRDDTALNKFAPLILTSLSMQEQSACRFSGFHSNRETSDDLNILNFACDATVKHVTLCDQIICPGTAHTGGG